MEEKKQEKMASVGLKSGKDFIFTLYVEIGH